MRNIIKVIFVLIGSIIGAGFASGQEIKIFFGNYGICGLISLILSFTIISVLINVFFKIILNKNVKTYDELIDCSYKNKVFGYVMKNLTNIFLLATFFVMNIGFATCLEEQFSLPKYIGIFLMSGICYITLCGNIDRIIKINMFIVPILIFIITISGIVISQNETIIIENEYNLQAFFNAFIYASYNVLPILPLFFTLKNEMNSVKKINLMTILLFVILIIPAISMYTVTNVKDIGESGILLLELSKNWNSFFRVLCSMAILLAIYTSSICAGYGFAKNVVKSEKGYKALIAIICIVTFFTINFDFSYSIKSIYPIFGVLGILQFIAVIVKLKR